MAVICIVASPFAMLGGVIMSKLKWGGPGASMAKNATQTGEEQKDDAYA